MKFTAILTLLPLIGMVAAVPQNIDLQCATKYCQPLANQQLECMKSNGMLNPDGTPKTDLLQPGKIPKGYVTCVCSPTTKAGFEGCLGCLSNLDDAAKQEYIGAYEMVCGSGTGSTDVTTDSDSSTTATTATTAPSSTLSSSPTTTGSGSATTDTTAPNSTDSSSLTTTGSGSATTTESTSPTGTTGSSNGTTTSASPSSTSNAASPTEASAWKMAGVMVIAGGMMAAL